MKNRASRLKEDLRSNFVCYALIFLVAFSLYIRRDVYLMPNLRGDQLIYTALAMKHEKGILFSEHSLYGLDMEEKDPFFMRFSFSGPGEKGRILELLNKFGVHFYEQEIFTTPPGFPYAILISRKIFGVGDEWVLPSRKWVPGNGLYTAFRYIQLHFYAIFAPLFFSTALIVTIFFLGREMFGKEAGFLAGLIFCMVPLNIVTSQKVWADDMTAFFVATAMFFMLRSWKFDRDLPALFAGACIGLSAITKGVGGYIVFAVLIFQLLIHFSRIKRDKTLICLGDKKIWLFALGVLLMCGRWYYLIYRTYGHPLFLWENFNIDPGAGGGWWEVLKARPWYMYIVNVPFQTPLLLAGHFALAGVFFKDTEKRRWVIFLIVWYLVYLWNVRFLREMRYILSGLPALTLLSGYYLSVFRRKISRNYGTMAGIIFICFLMILNFAWSVPIGRKVVLSDHAVLRVPF